MAAVLNRGIHSLAQRLLLDFAEAEMKSKFLMVLISSSFLWIFPVQADVVQFRIEANTSKEQRDWNKKESPLVAKVGDTLIIHNDDDDTHQLHALGVPCEHGDPILPGQSWTCILKGPYDSRNESDPIRDHKYYEQKFWLVVLPN